MHTGPNYIPLNLASLKLSLSTTVVDFTAMLTDSRIHIHLRFTTYPCCTRRSQGESICSGSELPAGHCTIRVRNVFHRSYQYPEFPLNCNYPCIGRYCTKASLHLDPTSTFPFNQFHNPYNTPQHVSLIHRPFATIPCLYLPDIQPLCFERAVS